MDSTNDTEKSEVAPPYYPDIHTCAFCRGQTWDPEHEIQETRRLPSYRPVSRESSMTVVDNKDSDPHLPAAYLSAIGDAIDTCRDELRTLSLKMCHNPELAYEEKEAHNLLTSYMEDNEFAVTRHFGLPTAWRAVYRSPHGKGGRTIGLNSEMDALPDIGHACGHNLIAISGVAVALSLKAFLETYRLPGTIVLLGTPAEEHGGGKIDLLEKGAYEGMDVCIMCHPSPGPKDTHMVAPWLALQPIEVTYTGRSAHAAYAPWEGQNALDAFHIAYGSIAVLRQQMKPELRVHGVLDSGHSLEPNVIPDFVKSRWIIRAPVWAELEDLRERVENCFNAGAIATGCKVQINRGNGYWDVRENEVLAKEYCRVAEQHFKVTAVESTTVIPASTDFGNITYHLPCITPTFSITTGEKGSNHSKGFAEAAETKEAHEATLTMSKCLAAIAVRVLTDDAFFEKVQQSFDKSKPRSNPQLKAESEPEVK